MKKRLKGLISVFLFLLCIFAWKSVQEVRAAENVIRDFSRIFYIPAGAVLKGGSLQKLQEIYDGMSCIAYTEDGEAMSVFRNGQHGFLYRIRDSRRFRCIPE